MHTIQLETISQGSPLTILCLEGKRDSPSICVSAQLQMVFRTKNAQSKECSEKNLRRSLENAYQRASDEAATSAAANKQRYDMVSKARIRLQTNGIKKFTLLSGGLMIIFLCTGSSLSLSLITSEPSIGI